MAPILKASLRASAVVLSLFVLYTSFDNRGSCVVLKGMSLANPPVRSEDQCLFGPDVLGNPTFGIGKLITIPDQHTTNPAFWIFQNSLKIHLLPDVHAQFFDLFDHLLDDGGTRIVLCGMTARYGMPPLLMYRFLVFHPQIVNGPLEGRI